MKKAPKGAKLAEQGGFEPPIRATPIRPLRDKIRIAKHEKSPQRGKTGGAGGIRTPDTDFVRMTI